MFSAFQGGASSSSSGTTPTGTGLRHITNGVEDPTAYALSGDDVTILDEITLSDYLIRNAVNCGLDRTAISMSTLGSNATGYSASFAGTLLGNQWTLIYSADQASATNGLRVQCSLDGGTTWDLLGSTANYSRANSTANITTTTAGLQLVIIQPPLLRLAVTNGASAQSKSALLLYWTRQLTVETPLVDTVLSPTLLGNGGVYTSPTYTLTKRRLISFIVVADRNSASNGVVLQWTPDGTDWYDLTTPVTLTAGTAVVLASVSNNPADLRLKYTNGTTTQGRFKIHVGAA